MIDPRRCENCFQLCYLPPPLWKRDLNTGKVICPACYEWKLSHPHVGKP